MVLMPSADVKEKRGLVNSFVIILTQTTSKVAVNLVFLGPPYFGSWNLSSRVNHPCVRLLHPITTQSCSKPRDLLGRRTYYKTDSDRVIVPK